MKQPQWPASVFGLGIRGGWKCSTGSQSLYIAEEEAELSLAHVWSARKGWSLIGKGGFMGVAYTLKNVENK